VLLRDGLQPGYDGVIPLVKDVHMGLEHHDVGANLSHRRIHAVERVILTP